MPNKHITYICGLFLKSKRWRKDNSMLDQQQCGCLKMSESVSELRRWGEKRRGGVTMFSWWFFSPLGPSTPMKQRLPLWLQLLPGSLRCYQLPPSEKAWHSDPQCLLCQDACSLILLCATGQPWCPTSVNASSIVCFKNPKSARSGSLSLFLCGSFLSPRQVVSLYNRLDLIDRNLSHLSTPSSHSSF